MVCNIEHITTKFETITVKLQASRALMDPLSDFTKLNFFMPCNDIFPLEALEQKSHKVKVKLFGFRKSLFYTESSGVIYRLYLCTI